MISPRKTIAGLLLIVGLPVVVFAALESRHASSETHKTPTPTPLLMVLGLVPTGIGGVMLWSIYDSNRRHERDRLRTVFFDLVKEGKGRISATDFAIETGLEPSDAKRYLDERSSRFNATFHIDDDNGIVYQFQLGFADPTSLVDDPPDATDDSLTFSVLLQTVPPEHREAILPVLQDIMAVDPDTLNDILDEPLLSVQKEVPLAIAQDYRQRLEAVGAKVLVALE